MRFLNPLMSLSILLATACGDDASGDADSGKDASGADGSRMMDAQSQDGSVSDGTIADGRAQDASVAPLAQEAFAAAFAESYCATVKPCCDAYGTYRTACVAEVTSQVESVLADLDTETAAYDPAFGGRCIQALKDAPRDDCVQSFEYRGAYRTPCRQAINGLVKPGAVCDGLAECEAQVGAAGSRDTGYVGCLPFDDEMSHCRYFEPVELGETCVDVITGGDIGVVPSCPSGAICEDSRCVPLPAEGEPCFEARCGDDLYCVNNAEPRICATRVAADGDCSASSAACDPCGGKDKCDENYWCVEDKCTVRALYDFFLVSFGHLRSILPSLACDE